MSFASKAIIIDAKFGARYELNAGETLIGRSAQNDVVLLGDMSVSRRHAIITRLGDDYVLDDLWSSNGTCINGVRINGTVVLQPDDVIFLGDRCLIFCPSEEDALTQRPASRSAALMKIASTVCNVGNNARSLMKNLVSGSGLKKCPLKPASADHRSCNAHLLELAAAVL